MASSIFIEGIHAAYGAVRVIEDVSMSVNGGETVVLLGTNGNGKSTLIKCIMGMVRPSAGRIVAEIDGTTHDLVGRTTEEIVDLGIALVPEGRRLFPKLTVEENLLLGAFRPTARAQIKENLEFCMECFPVLRARSPRRQQHTRAKQDRCYEVRSGPQTICHGTSLYPVWGSSKIRPYSVTSRRL